MKEDAQAGILGGKPYQAEVVPASGHIHLGGPRAGAPFSDTIQEVGKRDQVHSEQSKPHSIILSKNTHRRSCVCVFCLHRKVLSISSTSHIFIVFKS